MIKDSGRPLAPFNKPGRASSEAGGSERTGLYASLLKNEVLGYQIEDCKDITPDKRVTPNRKLFNVRYSILIYCDHVMSIHS